VPALAGRAAVCPKERKLLRRSPLPLPCGDPYDAALALCEEMTIRRACRFLQCTSRPNAALLQAIQPRDSGGKCHALRRAMGGTNGVHSERATGALRRRVRRSAGVVQITALFFHLTGEAMESVCASFAA